MFFSFDKTKADSGGVWQISELFIGMIHMSSLSSMEGGYRGGEDPLPFAY